MRAKVLTIISIGITIGFLLGMGVVALLQAIMDGKEPGLEITFTALSAVMVAVLISYIVKTTR